MSFYVRNLPHWHPDGAPLFVTWRLWGSLPNCIGERSFAAYDNQLDMASFGPTWLQDERVAKLMADALTFAERDLRLYELLAWVIMPNHVHIVVQPNAALQRITKTLKGFTGKRANEILSRRGQPFWQDESYDHWIRDRYELPKVIGYVENNPVKAGFVDRVQDWRWSSAFGLE